MMTTINRSNYEIFFIDYFDGRLDEKSQRELFTFLKDNADLKDEFDRFTDVAVESNSLISFAGKERLKKDTITLYNYKTWFAAYVENDLSEFQKTEVEAFLSKNNSFKTELEILKQIRLVPDEQIIFSKKNSLKKKGKVISFSSVIKPLTVAAAITALFILSYFIIQNQSRKEKEVAEKPALEIPIKPSIDSSSNSTNNFAETPNKINETPRNNEVIIPGPKKVINSPINKIIKQEMHVAENNKIIKEKYDSTDNFKPELKNDITVNNNSENFIKSSVMNKYTDKDSLPIQLKNLWSKVDFRPILINAITAGGIFSEEELKEFSQNQEDVPEIKNNENSLMSFVGGKMKELSKAADVIVQKENDPSGNSVTYALGIGKYFSISHTRAK